MLSTDEQNALNVPKDKVHLIDQLHCSSALSLMLHFECRTYFYYVY